MVASRAKELVAMQKAFIVLSVSPSGRRVVRVVWRQPLLLRDSRCQSLLCWPPES